MPPTLSPLRRRFRSTAPSLRLPLLLTALLCSLPLSIRAQMPAAPAGQTEIGVPNFVVFGPEALGLSSSPTDLHFLSDGRILVTAQREIAFGDGVRWETYRRLANDQTYISGQVMVDHDGRIYTGIEGGFARIDLLEDARWDFRPVANLPKSQSLDDRGVSAKVCISGDRWYWYGGGSALFTWRPGTDAQAIAHTGATTRVIAAGAAILVSDQASGQLYRVDLASRQTVNISPPGTTAVDMVSCSTAFAPGQWLLGTAGAGLKLFDGITQRPFPAQGVLNSQQSINDLCPVGDGLFAAAVDTIGIVIFNREGRIVQLLDRSLDHRLAHVRRLLHSPDGVLWALLNNGLARLELPSPFSDFAPLVPTGLNYAALVRHDNRLWMLSDSKIQRGVYDPKFRRPPRGCAG